MPLSTAINAPVLDATTPCGPLRTFGKFATSLLIEFEILRNYCSVADQSDQFHHKFSSTDIPVLGSFK